MKDDTFKTLLKKIDTDELRQFIHLHALAHPEFKTEVQVYFSDKDDRIDLADNYRSLVHSIVGKYEDRGYITYRRASDVSAEIDRLTEKGYSFAEKKDFRKALKVAEALLLPTTEIIQYSDDSGGYIGESIAYIIKLIDLIAEDGLGVNGLADELFEFLGTELQNNLYFDYGDFGYDLFTIFHSLSVQLKRTDSYLNFVKNKMVNLKVPSDEYQINYLKTKQIEFYQEVGLSEEANKLISENMDLVDVRKTVLEKLLARQDYQSAKKLIKEGIQVAEAKEHPGTVIAWQKDLLHIATLEGDIGSVRRISKILAFDRGLNRTYYAQWKSTFPANEWKSVIEETIAERTAEVTAEQKRMPRNLWRLNHALLRELGPIFIQEGHWDNLLTLVQNDGSLMSVSAYHPYLHAHYPDALVAMYVPLFLKRGEQASDRSAYAELVREMKKVIKDIPSSSAPIKGVAQQLREKFPRRPAMLDELSKL